MDWVDLLNGFDFYFKKYNIDKKTVTILNYSTINPNDITKNDAYVNYFIFFGNDEKKIEKIINIINQSVSEMQTNRTFWEKVLKNHAKEHVLRYESPDAFLGTKEAFIRKNEIDAGKYDNITKK